MGLVANILIGYKNLCLESGVTFTASSAHADHPVTNLGKPHPESFWRLTTLTGNAKVEVDLNGIYDYGVVAPLYVTASPNRNRITNATDFTSSNWTKLNASPGNWTIGTPVVNGRASSIRDNATSGEHYADQAIALPTAGGLLFEGGAQRLVFQGWFRENTTINAQVRIGNASHYALAKLDLTNGTLQSSSSLGNCSIVSATVTTDGDDGGASPLEWYKLVLILDHTFASTGDMDVRINCLDASFNASYSGASTHLVMVGLDLRFATAVEAVNVTGDEGGVTWAATLRVASGSTIKVTSDLRSIASQQGQGQSEVHGWVHLRPYVIADVDQTNGAPVIDVQLWNPDNAAAQLDTSIVYIGPVWQPTQNIKSLAIRPARTREWTIDLGFQSRADAWAEAHAMGIKDRLTDGLSVGRSYSGAEYVAELNPILVIIDPDETTYGQEMILYGRLTDFQMHASRVLLDTSDNVMRPMPAVSFSLRELLPG